jgi:POT family proton-dependent oligopeptide transporter
MSQPNPGTTQRSSVFDHPLGFWFFFWGEFAERCCYYGMRAVLLLYMIQILKFEDSTANRISSYFLAACYLLPLVGGYIADNFLGKYRTIVYFAIPYIFGQTLLGVASLHNETCLYLSLGLLAMGSGVIKPNISTLMGLTYDQRRPGQTKLRSDAFAIFYGSINIGAALSSFCVPAIRNYYGGDSHAYAMAFLFPAALMILAFIVFAAGKPFYATETIQRVRLTPEQRRERWVVLRRLFGLFFIVMIFWSIFDQSTCTWILFARDHLHLHLNLYFWVIPLSPDQLQALNPILIIVMLPPITMLWHLLARFGLELRPTDKMLIGFVLTTLTMGITAWSAFRGADTVTAGASAALTNAEKTVAVATTLAHNDSADKAAQGLMDAAAGVQKAKNLPSDSQEFKAAKAAMEVAVEAAKKTGPEAVSVATAGRAAAAAIHAARLASDIEGKTAGVQHGAGKAAEELQTAVRAAKDAAEATEEAVKLVTSAGRERDAASDGSAATKIEKVDLTVCSVAANSAAAAASAAGRSADAAAAGNTRAAQVNAAVAGVDSADAAVAAVKAAANISKTKVPAVVVDTEKATAAARISLLWQIIPYILITMAEICISVVGLELAFAAAPASMKSFVTALWLLTVFCGDLLNAQVTPLYNETFWGISLTPDWYFLLFALLMVPVTIAFAIVARRFNRPVKPTE